MTSDIDMRPLKKKENETVATLEWKRVTKLLEVDDDIGLRHLLQEWDYQTVLRPSRAPGKTTAFHAAVLSNATRCLSVLIDIRPSEDVFNSPDYEGNTPLHVAVKHANVGALESLLNCEGIHLNARNVHGNSCLHTIAYAIGNTKCKQVDDLLMCSNLLISKQGVDLEAHNNTGYTPLMSAALSLPENETSEHFRGLIAFSRQLASAGASLTTEDKAGNTPEEVFKKRRTLPPVLMIDRTHPPARPLLSQILDCLIMGKDEQILKDLLKAKREPINVNCYLGSQTLLFYAVDRNDKNLVKALLTENANPWKIEISGQFSLHRALSRGNYLIVNELIEGMKKHRNSNTLDLSECTFSLLQNLLESQKKASQSGDNDHGKCLKRLFQSDVKLNVNQNQGGEVVKQTPLHLAASFNNQDALSELIKSGAFLGSIKTIADQDCGSVLNVLLLPSLEKAMDGCIEYKPSEGEEEEDVLSQNHTLSLDYRFLVPEQNSDEKNNNLVNEAEVLMDLKGCMNLRNFIKHPLIQTFLYAKWRKVLPLFVVNLLLYLLFVVILTGFVYKLADLKRLEDILDGENSTVFNASQNDASNEGSPHSAPNMTAVTDSIQAARVTVHILMAFLLPATLYMIIREIFQIIFAYRVYLSNLENWLEWFLIVVVAVLFIFPLSDESTRHLAAWAMIVAWYEFVLILGRAPPLAIYVTMLRHVSWNFLKLIFLYGALILAFSISFNIIFQQTSAEQTSFGNLWLTLPRAMVMATGEFEYTGLTSGFSVKLAYTVSTILVFLVFLFLIFLVLMNVMNGLAVTDTQKVIESATVYSLQSRLELIYLIEQLFMKIPFLKYYLSKIHLITGGRQPRLLIYVNNPKSKKRIRYGDERARETCKLDDNTTAILRSYRIEKLEEERRETSEDPLSQCRLILQEIKSIASRR